MAAADQLRRQLKVQFRGENVRLSVQLPSASADGRAVGSEVWSAIREKAVDGLELDKADAEALICRFVDEDGDRCLLNAGTVTDWLASLPAGSTLRIEAEVQATRGRLPLWSPGRAAAETAAKLVAGLRAGRTVFASGGVARGGGEEAAAGPPAKSARTSGAAAGVVPAPSSPTRTSEAAAGAVPAPSPPATDAAPAPKSAPSAPEPAPRAASVSAPQALAPPAQALCDSLLQTVQADDERVRRTAFKAIVAKANLGGPEAIRAAGTLVRHQDEHIRRGATDVAVNWLTTAVMRKDGHELQEALRIVVPLAVSSEDEQVRRGAAEAVCFADGVSSCNKQVLDALELLVEHEDEQIRMLARTRLNKLTPVDC